MFHAGTFEIDSHYAHGDGGNMNEALAVKVAFEKSIACSNFVLRRQVGGARGLHKRYSNRNIWHVSSSSNISFNFKIANITLLEERLGERSPPRVDLTGYVESEIMS